MTPPFGASAGVFADLDCCCCCCCCLSDTPHASFPFDVSVRPKVPDTASISAACAEGNPAALLIPTPPLVLLYLDAADRFVDSNSSPFREALEDDDAAKVEEAATAADAEAADMDADVVLWFPVVTPPLVPKDVLVDDGNEEDEEGINPGAFCCNRLRFVPNRFLPPPGTGGAPSNEAVDSWCCVVCDPLPIRCCIAEFMT